MATSDAAVAPAPVGGARWRYRLRLALREPTTVIAVLMAALFAYLIVVPILSILSDAATVQFGDERRTAGETGSFTAYYLYRAFASPVAHDLFWEPLLNTLKVAFGAIAISLSVGGVLAWLIARTDMFGRRWFATALIAPA